jgi:isoleucyl-tRNA synthetase
LSEFIDDLSNWYVRLSRTRFWHGDPAALQTLYETLGVLTRLLAPFVPFVADYVWQHAVRPGDESASESVHLATWPVPDPAGRDDDLRAQMSVVRALVDAGRAARKANNLRVRQPLARGLVGVPDRQLPSPELLAYVSDELNLRELTTLATAGEVVDVTVKPNFRELGKRFGSRTQQVAAAIGAADPVALSAAVRAGDATVPVDGEPVALGEGDVFVNQKPRTGWAVATQGDVTIALDTTITPELRRAGLAREAIRLVQEARKQAGLAITDRISLVWAADGETATAIREHERDLADAVLARSVTEGDPGAESTVDEDLGLRFAISPVPA